MRGHLLLVKKLCLVHVSFFFGGGGVRMETTQPPTPLRHVAIFHSMLHNSVSNSQLNALRDDWVIT
jgi:hypothetical protein